MMESIINTLESRIMFLHINTIDILLIFVKFIKVIINDSKIEAIDFSAGRLVLKGLSVSDYSYVLATKSNF